MKRKVSVTRHLLKEFRNDNGQLWIKENSKDMAISFQVLVNETVENRTSLIKLNYKITIDKEIQEWKELCQEHGCEIPFLIIFLLVELHLYTRSA